MEKQYIMPATRVDRQYYLATLGVDKPAVVSAGMRFVEQEDLTVLFHEHIFGEDCNAECYIVSPSGGRTQ